MQLRGKRTLVTGASGALAPSVIEAFLALGSEVLAADERRTALDELRARLGHHDRLDVAECDLGDGEGATRLFEAWARQGATDVVVHDGGEAPAGRLEDRSDEDITVALRGTAMATIVLREALRTMTDGGSVVMLGAGGASDPASPLGAAGAASVAQLVESAARGRGDLRINAVLTDAPAEDASRVARTAAWLAGADSDGISGTCVRLVGRRGDVVAPGGFHQRSALPAQRASGALER